MVNIAGRPYQVDTKRQLFRSLEDAKTIIPFDRTLVANHEVYIAFERGSGRPYSGKVTKDTFENPGLRIKRCHNGWFFRRRRWPRPSLGHAIR